MDKKQKYILWFNEITNQDVSLVGGKNASLGEMYRNLVKKGINIPNGFAVTTLAYWQFLEQAGLKEKIFSILEGLDITDIKELKKRGVKVRNLILSADLPKEIQEEIRIAYRKLSQEYQVKETDVAVRSSASAEDLPTASFAGQQESFLNIQGEEALLRAVKKCQASLFTDRAIVYRQEQGFEGDKVGLSVCVQKMVRSDLACSGVMFSCDTESNFGDIILINSSYGLGDNIVQGKVNPDQFYVFETTLKRGYQPIVSKILGTKKTKLVYQGKNVIKDIPVLLKEQQKFSLTEEEILLLAKWSCLIEDYYKRSMDMEWAKDGQNKKLYIVQARPETVQSQKQVNVLEKYVFKLGIEARGRKTLIQGLSIGDKIAQGKVKIIREVKDIDKFEKGRILVTKMTDPDWVPIMKMAKAIITDLGGRTCHSAIVSRELGIPCIVGTNQATKVLKEGQEITVSCAEGEIGKVYQDLIPFEIERTNITKLKKPKTKIMMNLGEPEIAFISSFIPNDGVGLARQEFIISNYIKIHPLALTNFDKLKEPKLKQQIKELTIGYPDKKQFFIDKLAEGIGKIGAAFYPKPVIVRLSDFKTNEYRNLVGGELFEPEEENPMLGWRGACRYLEKEFQPAFEMECQALKKTREKFGLKNIWIMVPFCRTVEEGKKVLELMKKQGLERGKDDLKIIVMCEVPSNVILAEQFLEIFDGMSIGSNDLTQLVLGLDRDNAKISYIGDERNEAVKKLIKEIIKISNQKKKYCGICGQGPSDFPDFAEFLIKEGIESISLTPDTIIKTMVRLAKEKDA